MGLIKSMCMGFHLSTFKPMTVYIFKAQFAKAADSIAWSVNYAI